MLIQDIIYISVFSISYFVFNKPLSNVWYDNGKIKIIEKWKNGVKINFEKSFTNGQIAQIQNFRVGTASVIYKNIRIIIS